MDKLASSINDNMKYITSRFKDCDDVVMRPFIIGKGITLYMIYTDNIVNTKVIEESIMTNLMLRANIDSESSEGILEKVKMNTITVGEVNEEKQFENLFTSILLGDTAILADGCDYALIISSKGWPTRGVQQADTEVVVEGPKDSFTESVSTNIVLVRRRIRDTRLKVKRQMVGTRSKTHVGIMYMEGLVRQEILDKVFERINSLDVDAILDSGYMEQLMEKSWVSPFPQMQLTERPDKTAAAIYEGRIAVIVDNTPFVMLIPSTLNVFFQAAEDYYDRWEIMTFMRIIRYSAAFMAVCLPGLYIALAVYHPYMFPTALALKIAGARVSIPFPAVVEVLIMEIAFELLREAGIRLPAPVSSTIGIVGGIIIGSAAVEAGIVSPIVVIVASLTGISTFVIPNSALVSGLRLCKYLVIALSAFLGLYGFWTAVLLILIHLSSLTSYGIPYMFPYCSGSVNNFGDLKDSIVRVPLFMMKKRPIFTNPREKKRMGGGK